MDRYDALTAALGVAHANQAPVEVDVVAVEAERLRAAQAGVREQGEQQPIALDLAGVHTLPHAVTGGHIQQAQL